MTAPTYEDGARAMRNLRQYVEGMYEDATAQMHGAPDDLAFHAGIKHAANNIAAWIDRALPLPTPAAGERKLRVISLAEGQEAPTRHVPTIAADLVARLDRRTGLTGYDSGTYTPGDSSWLEEEIAALLSVPSRSDAERRVIEATMAWHAETRMSELDTCFDELMAACAALRAAQAQPPA